MLTKTTLEQWIVLQTVVETGGYVQAAKILNKSQSSVSYSLNTLQERLNLQLLHIVGRKAELTDAGRMMLAQARPLLTAFKQLELSAAGLRSGVRPSLNLVVDSVFPKSILLCSLKKFQESHPQTQIHLSEILRTERESELSAQQADLYITTLNSDSAVSGSPLIEIDFIAVAAARHPLHSMIGPISAPQLMKYPLITLTDKVSQQQGMKKISSMSNWSFTTVDAVIEAVCHGIGYGWLPRYHIQHLLDSGELKALPVSIEPTRKTVFYLVFGIEGQCYDNTILALADIIKAEAIG
ncbi:LysR family transcriptional regulator [Photobacterium lipolyticum]|uniref:LysR family transcriptional regulator n=1 Tax=Photobacterium lipolyticum TaxID=266810 RepID=A0A2T3N356_9GAMM|nr:LysR family transcriptional regulator [Photobacterium lipolyticum]PSW06789.1 LysR family transcriptional regulator [Photobacterium lipolyticum]